MVDSYTAKQRALSIIIALKIVNLMTLLSSIRMVLVILIKFQLNMWTILLIYPSTRSYQNSANVNWVADNKLHMCQVEDLSPGRQSPRSLHGL